ncbi:MAG: HPr(Ser) kinase/phosphatase [Gammaproteobacteria bacterium]|nr:HPr(Ser) kinase/phosphatase [Gammaproteobacteria bacterium]MDH5653650.1 HPr(Ser) kinase/phosphatase [Gammaproteobacteria bacterium]
MTHSISIQQLFSSHHKQLKLEWISGREHNITITPDRDELDEEVLAGYFNSVHPNQIQIIGHKELAYLTALTGHSLEKIFNALDNNEPSTFIIANNAETPTELLEFVRSRKIALLRSALPGAKLIEYLRYYLAELFSDRITRHGVFMEVMGLGVLISGASGIGKSELALELLSRGHRLIADDAPEFFRAGPEIIHGRCPPALHGFLEVRGLGILNVRAMFGETAILNSKRLRLVIRMQLFSEQDHTKIDRLSTTDHYENILDAEIPVVVLPVAPGRNLAVIVEAAVRNHVLLLSGYNATEDFIKRQQKLINQNDS